MPKAKSITTRSGEAKVKIRKAIDRLAKTPESTKMISTSDFTRPGGKGKEKKSITTKDIRGRLLEMRDEKIKEMDEVYGVEDQEDQDE